MGAAESTPASSYEGTSIIKQLSESSYGKFMEAIGSVKLPCDEYKLPRVVVVGVQNSGKSSVLERILKCPILPRGNRTLTTRAPIHICLQRSKFESARVTVTFRGMLRELKFNQEILEHIMDLFRGLVDISGNPVATEDPVTVTLEAPNIPTLELVDLPGIQEFPPSLAATTQAILAKYMPDPDNVFVCVVEAMSSIITNAAVAAVLTYKRQDSCVLALSGSDIVPSHELDDKLLKRIARVSMDIRSAGMAGCVALANGGLGEYLTLSDVEVAEADLFSSLLSQVPPNCPYVMTEMLQNVTADRLIAKVEALLHKRIRDTWQARATSQLTAQLMASNEALQRFGTPITSLQPEDIILGFMHVAHEDMLAPSRCQYFSRKLADMHTTVPYDPTREYAHNAACRVHKAFVQYVGEPASSPLLEDLKRVFGSETSGFLEEFPDDAHLMLMRFDRLVVMARTCVVEAIDAHAGAILAACKSAGMDLLLRGVADMGAVHAACVERLYVYLGVVLAQELFVDKADSHVYKNFHANRPYFLVESEAWMAKRAGSRGLVDKIMQASFVVENIDNYLTK